MRAAARKNHGSAESTWRRRQLVLPHEVAQQLFHWHGGQGSAVYSLASTGDHDLVSLSMIDAALGELEQDLGKLSAKHAKADKKDRHDLRGLIAELENVRLFWHEFTAKAYGLEEHDSGYDQRDYGMTDAEERAISTRSG